MLSFKTHILKLGLFHHGNRLLLAVSGGLDSMVLATLCKQEGYDFIVAHCNFQLRGSASDRDEAFVVDWAKQQGVQCLVVRFDTNQIAVERKTGVEETARELRYQWFEQMRQEHQCQYILTAHHADDNIETVGMNFFRGTGIRGLRGILPKQGKIIRPLLSYRRSALEQYAKENGIGYVMDHTNAENIYTRNDFRNTILPLVQKHYPGADENMIRNIERWGEAAILYEQAVELHKKKLMTIKGNEVFIPVLKLLKTVPLNTILFEITRSFGFTAHQVEEIAGLLKSESGKWISSGTHRILRNRKWLIIAPLETREAQHIIIEKETSSIDWEGGKLGVKLISNDRLNIDKLSAVAQMDLNELQFPLLLRRWKQGDYFYPLGMDKKKKVSRFLIDQKLSLIEKEHTWVLESGKKICWIVGRRIDDRFKLRPSTTHVFQLTYLPK